jgi:adenylate cyclase
MPRLFPLSTNRRRKRKTGATIVLVVLSFAVSQLCFMALQDLFESWNAQAIDRLFKFRSASERFRPAYDDAIVHVDLSNTTIQQLSNFYLNRSHYAQVIRNLASMRASAQMYDFIFAARTDESQDSALIHAASEAGSAYFGMAFELSERGAERQKGPRDETVRRYLDATDWSIDTVEGPGDFYIGTNPLITFPDLAGSSRGQGFLSIKPDRDGVFRRAPLLVKWNGGYYPSLPFRIACDYLGVSPDRILIDPGRSITLKDARRPGGPVHDIVIPIDRRGNMTINFIGPWERMLHYNFADVFRASEDRDEMEIWREELEGKIVLVSDVSTGSSDIGAVPTDVNFPLSGLHANVVHTILSGEFLRELSPLQTFAVELALAAVALFLALSYSSLFFSISVFALAAMYVGGAALSFLHGLLIPNIVRPLFLMTIFTVAISAYRYISEERERLVLRKTFEAYFPPSVVEKIVENPEMITAAGQKKELTILFSDIKSFTTYSASLTPDQIQRSLNEYFDAMVEVVFNYQGTVDKYIGDGLMVFFGDPEPQPDHALRCVHAAIGMQRKVRDLKEKWEKQGGIPIRIRIGINTGVVVVGNMGSARRLSYTVLGSAVNLAQRLESNAPVDGILISERTYELVKDKVPTRSPGAIKVKGIDEPVTVYEVITDGQPTSDTPHEISTAAAQFPEQRSL